jgi:hypothetical protein
VHAAVSVSNPVLSIFVYHLFLQWNLSLFIVLKEKQFNLSKSLDTEVSELWKHGWSFMSLKAGWVSSSKVE